MSRIKVSFRSFVFILCFGAASLLALPAQAEGNWFWDGETDNYRLEYFRPSLFGYNSFSVDDLPPVNYQRPEDRTRLQENLLRSPLHVTQDNDDRNNTHVTFGTGSAAGPYTPFTRYVYYPNANSWAIRRDGGVDTFGHYEDFSNAVNQYMYFLQTIPNDAFVTREMSDARQAIGLGEPGGISVLVSWWRNYNAPDGSTGNSSLGAIPSPAPSAFGGSSRSGLMYVTFSLPSSF